MYIVWNRRIWGTWSRRWETYCLERRRGCVDPDNRKVVKNPHTDHVHFSFSRPAARMETSFWRRRLSYP
jgi:hypothetical protein